MVLEGFVDQIYIRWLCKGAVSCIKILFKELSCYYISLNFLFSFLLLSCFGADLCAACAFYMCIHTFSEVRVAKCPYLGRSLLNQLTIGFPSYQYLFGSFVFPSEC